MSLTNTNPRPLWLNVGLATLFTILALALISLTDGAAGENATFGSKTYITFDEEEDSFDEMVIFTFDIDTNESGGQKGWLIIEVRNDTAFFDTQSIFFNVTGNASDPFDWNWSCNFTDTYNFTVRLRNLTNDTLLHEQFHDIDLAVASPNAWFGSKTGGFTDSEEDGFTETLHMEFDIDTWNNFTQNGWLTIDIYNSSNALIDINSYPYNVTGDDDVTFDWQWVATYSDMYTFAIYIYDETNSTEFHNQNHTLPLDVAYESAWFGSKTGEFRDSQEDSFFETLYMEFDIDTWNNYTQKGWLTIDIYNNSNVLIDVNSYHFNVTGDDDLFFQWEWVATYSDMYTFVIYLYSEDNATEFHNQNHTLPLDMPTPRATFISDLNWTEYPKNGSQDETAFFEFEFDTWNNYTQDLWVTVNVTRNGTQVDWLFMYFPIFSNDTDAIEINWTSSMPGNYTFHFEFFDMINLVMFHSQNDTVTLMSQPYPWVWFAYFTDTSFDLEDDGFDETVTLGVKIETWTGWTQDFWLFYGIYNSTDVLIGGFEGPGNVTADEQPGANLTFTADEDGTYTFRMELWDLSNTTLFDLVEVEVDLATPYESAWLSAMPSGVKDLEEDGFNETAYIDFDLDTWNNWTQKGYVEVVVFDSGPTQVHRSLIPYNATGNTSVDWLHWEWSASYNDTYYVELNVFNEAQDELFESKNTTLDLYVPYDKAWMVSPMWSVKDEDGDGFNETLVLEFDIDTWNNWTQEGWIEVEIRDGSGALVNTTLVPYNVTGDANETFIINWTAPDTDTYSFNVGLSNTDNSSTFQGDNGNQDLEVFAATFDVSSQTKDIILSDSFEETADFTIDVLLEEGKTGRGPIQVIVRDSSGIVETKWLSYSVSGDDGPPVTWYWSASATDTYTFEFRLYNPDNDTLLDTETELLDLSVSYPDAWFKVTPTHTEDDPNGDGFDERATFQIDIDTWPNLWQEGWVNITVYDTTTGGRAVGTLIDFDGFYFNIRGAPVDSYTWRWSALRTDYYDFRFELRNLANATFMARDSGTTLLEVNVAPTAGITANPNPADEDESVTLNAGGSLDANNNIDYYLWNFGDGSPENMSKLNKVTHTWTQTGNYLVTVKVVDTSGAFDNASVTVTVNEVDDEGFFAGLLGLDVEDDTCCPLLLLLLFLLLLLLCWKFKLCRFSRKAAAVMPPPAPAAARPENITTDGRPMDARHLYFITRKGDLARVQRTPELDRQKVTSTVHIEAKTGLKPFHQAMLFYVDVDPQLLLPGHFPEEEEEDYEEEPEPEPVSDKKYYRTHIQKEPGYMYFLDKNGDLARTKMARGTEPGGGRELLLEIGLKRDSQYLYFVDKDGDIARTRRVIGGQEKVMSMGEEKETTTPPPPPRPKRRLKLDEVVMKPWKLLYTVNKEMVPNRFYTIGDKRNIQELKLDLDEEDLEKLEEQAEIIVEAKMRYEPGYACQIYYRHPGDQRLPERPAEPPTPKAKPKDEPPKPKSEPPKPKAKPEPKPPTPKPKPEPKATPPRLDMETYGINKEPGYFYFLDKEGNVSRTRKAQGTVPGGDREVVGYLNLERQPGYLYFINKHGFIGKAKLKRYPKKKKK